MLPHQRAAGHRARETGDDAAVFTGREFKGRLEPNDYGLIIYIYMKVFMLESCVEQTILDLSCGHPYLYDHVVGKEDPYGTRILFGGTSWLRGVIYQH